MTGNAFNYCFFVGTIVAVIGLCYCIARRWIGSQPSLAAGCPLGAIIGAGVLAIGYFLVALLQDRHLINKSAAILLGLLLTVSLVICCAVIVRRSRLLHASPGSLTMAIAFGVISSSTVGMWLGVMITVWFVRPLQ